MREVLSFFELLEDDGEDAARVFLKDAKEEGCDGLTGSEAEDVEHVGFVNFVSTEGDELVQHGLGVAHAAIGTFGDSPGGGVIQLYALFGGDVLEVAGDDLGGDGTEVEALAARDDSGEDLVRFGGGEDELHVGGRLF